MDYQEFIQPVQKLGFIGDPDQADAAAKAVLGILASRLEPDDARRLTEKLPEPLTLDRLRGHQVRTPDLSVDQYVAEIATKFRLNHEQASELVDTVLHEAWEAAGDGTMNDIRAKLPPDWGK